MGSLTSICIWYTARPDVFSKDGWLWNYVDALPSGDILRGVSVGTRARALASPIGSSPAIRDALSYSLKRDPNAEFDSTNRNAVFEQLMTLPRPAGSLQDFSARTALDATISSLDLIRGLDKYDSTIVYPETFLGNRFRSCARIIAADLGVRVLYLRLDGFDTHAGQARADDNLQGKLGNLLAEASQAIEAFYEDLLELGVADRVLIMTFSEFGRRLAENGSSGTDHGTANTMFFVGRPVRGGFAGTPPSLAPDDLDPIGDMIHTVDFRQAYATALGPWLGADANQILSGDFPPLDILL